MMIFDLAHSFCAMAWIHCLLSNTTTRGCRQKHKGVLQINFTHRENIRLTGLRSNNFSLKLHVFKLPYFSFV